MLRELGRNSGEQGIGRGKLGVEFTVHQGVAGGFGHGGLGYPLIS